MNPNYNLQGPNYLYNVPDVFPPASCIEKLIFRSSYLEVFRPKDLQLYEKEAPTQVFSYKLSEIFKNTFL